MDVSKYGAFISDTKDSTLANNFGKSLSLAESKSFNTKEEPHWEVQEEDSIA